MPVLLAFDTATPQVVVAVHDGERVVCELTAPDAMKHGEQLAPLIHAALAEAKVDRRDLTEIAVGVGPGPFTGLRVGLVTARTLAHVLGIPVRGVCSLDILAAQAAVEASPQGNSPGDFLVATDARRKEVYVATYAADGTRRAGPAVGKPAALATELSVAGPGPTLYPDAFPHAIAPTRPSAGWLAQIVAERSVEVLPPEPLYLRRPDAVAPGKPKSVS